MIELRRHLDRLTARWLLLVVPVVLGCGGGLMYTWLASPTYQSSTLVVATELQPGGDRRDVSFGQAYGRLIDQQSVLRAAADAGGLTVEQVRGGITSSTSPDSPMIEITGTGDTPENAADIVNAAADAIVDIAATRTPDTGVRLIVVTPGMPPDTPVSPILLVDVAVGAAAGLLVGLLVLLGDPGRGARAGREDHVAEPSRAEADGGGSTTPDPHTVPIGPDDTGQRTLSGEYNGGRPSPSPRS